MGRFEHRHPITQVGARGQTEAARQPGDQVGEYVPVPVRRHHRVEQLRLFHQQATGCVERRVVGLEARIRGSGWTLAGHF